MWNHSGPGIEAENSIASSSRAAPPNHSAANQSAKGKEPVKEIVQPETTRGESSRISAKGKERLNDTPQPEIRQGESTRFSAKGKEHVDENLQSETLRGKSSRTSTFQKTRDFNPGKEMAKVEQDATRTQLSAESKVISDDMGTIIPSVNSRLC
jgi:hypothetical protein